MNMIAHGRVTASILIFGGFAVLVVSGTILGSGWMNDIIGCVAFFVVGCFLPETRPVTFLSRRSSLGLVGFFSWMAGTDFLRYRETDFWATENPMLFSTIAVAGPIFLGMFTYWLSVFLIRGFRAKPEYEIDTGEQTPSNGGQHECTSNIARR